LRTSPKLPKTLDTQLQRGAILPGLTKLLTRDGLVEIGGVSWLQTPETPVTPGEQWSYESRRSDTFFGVQVMKYDCRYEGDEEIEGRALARIAVGSTVSYEPGESLPAQVELEVLEQSAEGHVYFDVAAQRPAKAHYELSATVSASGMGRQSRQELTIKHDIEFAKLSANSATANE